MSTQTLPRILSGIGEQPMSELASHLAEHGEVPKLSSEQILGELDRAGLRGHGGASFPVATKMRAVAARRKPKILVANGAEGEPASKKDRMLLRELPHLVLDGAALAARATGARTAIIAVCEEDQRGTRGISRALQQRDDARLKNEPRFELVLVPERYISGQESALVNSLSGGPGNPTFGPRPFERGVRGRPTLVNNVETLAHIALIARHGASWFRQVGTERYPGSALVTLSGSVQAPGVYEIDPGMRLDELLDDGGVAGDLRAVLLGGYFGSWLSAGALTGLRLAPEDLADHGASLGAGVIVALGSTACPVAETARVAGYFSSQSAGQCGPCVNGLQAIADTVQRVASGTAPRTAQWDLERWATELPGRGACQLPDGAVRFMRSALSVFAEEFREHARRGPCAYCSRAPVLPTPMPAFARRAA
jgi:NADH:ubiquinone oxidoreductase subunit F (NADH-binding)